MMRRLMHGVVGILRFLGTVLFSVLLFGAIPVGYQIYMNGASKCAELSSGWWAGYSKVGDVTLWHLVRFLEADSQPISMAILDAKPEPHVYSLKRDESNAVYCEFTMNERYGPSTIVAKQLYEGKVYMLQRLFVGRWRDFWKRNDELAIRGTRTIDSLEYEFAIEPVADSTAASFWEHRARHSAATFSDIQTWTIFCGVMGEFSSLPE